MIETVTQQELLLILNSKLLGEQMEATGRLSFFQIRLERFQKHLSFLPQTEGTTFVHLSDVLYAETVAKNRQSFLKTEFQIINLTSRHFSLLI